MSARWIDYLDDPNAPAPTSVVPSANVIVVNDEGMILLIPRTGTVGDTSRRQTQ
jgi:hypothetical protein